MRTRRFKERPDWQWPSWRYGPNGEAAIFQKEEDVPSGWTKKPGESLEVFEPKPAVVHDEQDLRDQLEALNIEVNPIWGVAHMRKVLDDASSAG